MTRLGTFLNKWRSRQARNAKTLAFRPLRWTSWSRYEGPNPAEKLRWRVFWGSPLPLPDAGMGPKGLDLSLWYGNVDKGTYPHFRLSRTPTSLAPGMARRHEPGNAQPSFLRRVRSYCKIRISSRATMPSDALM